VSSFSVGGTGVTFDATADGFSDKGGPLEEITVGLLIENASAWGALFSLRSWNVSQRPVPGGNNVIVDIGGGAGVGSLSIDNLDSHQAILITLTRAEIEPGTLRSRGSATFLVTD
jgi:hypothetical protein